MSTHGQGARLGGGEESQSRSREAPRQHGTEGPGRWPGCTACHCLLIPFASESSELIYKMGVIVKTYCRAVVRTLSVDRGRFPGTWRVHTKS